MYRRSGVGDLNHALILYQSSNEGMPVEGVRMYILTSSEDSTKVRRRWVAGAGAALRP